MGVNFKDILVRHPIKLEQFSGKILVVDGYNMLYQFLSSIRSRDGSLFTDHHGHVTSHLIGLFSRVTNLMQKGLKLAFAFDGEVPKLKQKELTKRAELKKEAAKKYEEALAAEDVGSMQKYAARTSRLTKDMVVQAQELLSGLGLPWVQAPSEGEAQAAHIARKGHAWAVSSQDYDSLLYGTPRLIQNLSIEGRRKLPGKLAYTTVEPLLIDLEENLKLLGLSREKLLWLAVLVGTDYAPGGVKGIGPKKGLALVKQHSSAESLFNSVKPDFDWQAVLDVFNNMPATDDYKLSWFPVDRKKVYDFLVNQHDFSAERVNKSLDAIAPAKHQKGLGDFV
ncbi:MAG TPA: flap endonuclease-1 [Candidatus Nanoarchaeia archaeon]|nr:flap endonuclease-1 [Candidatus Nanoarchaeia archaeon]